MEPLSECPNIHTNWGEDVVPELTLDPTRFITGSYIWGPNNQSRGLRELVLMAVKMNRTIALPPFFKHWGTDTTVEKKSTPVNAETRLDVDTLRFISKYQSLSECLISQELIWKCFKKTCSSCQTRENGKRMQS